MAQQVIFTCDGCGHTVESWDDGNPYYIEKGLNWKDELVETKS